MQKRSAVCDYKKLHSSESACSEPQLKLAYSVNANQRSEEVGAISLTQKWYSLTSILSSDPAEPKPAHSANIDFEFEAIISVSS